MNAAAPTLRQLVEGMALSFDPGAAAGRRAVIEFEAPGERPPRCHLVVEGGTCRFAPGQADGPTLRVRTDGETWARIGAGELDFLAAAGSGELAVSGDLGDAASLGRWFRRDARAPLRDEAGRPPGPVRLPAMAWLAVGFAPWKAYFLGAVLLGPRPGALLGAALSALLCGYRRRFGGATFFEVASLLALLALAALPLPGGLRAAALGLAALSAVWGLGATRPLPLTGGYARWRYLPALAGTALFRHPNAAITVAWSAAFLACGSALLLQSHGLLGGAAVAVIQAGALAGCAAFTRAQEGGARTRRVEDIDRRLSRLRAAGLGLALPAAGLAAAAMR